MEVVLLRDLTSRMVITLLVFSLIAMGGFRLGWMDSKFDGLASILSYAATGASRTERSDDNGAPPFTVRCTIESNVKSGSCGLAFILSTIRA